ncbi:hypothetical protein ACNZ61_003005 [Enterococcus hirae]
MGNKRQDLTNQWFGSLFVKSEVKEFKYRYQKWHCICECGNERIVSYYALVKNESCSCGCKRLKHLRESYDKKRINNVAVHLITKKLPTNNTTGYKGVHKKGIAIMHG